jgi:hypothetical protein
MTRSSEPRVHKNEPKNHGASGSSFEGVDYQHVAGRSTAELLHRGVVLEPCQERLRIRCHVLA